MITAGLRSVDRAKGKSLSFDWQCQEPIFITRRLAYLRTFQILLHIVVFIVFTLRSGH